MPSLVHRVARSLMHCYPLPRGQGRIVDSTALSKLRFDEPTLNVRCLDGFSMTIMPNDLIGRHIYLTGQFDRTIVEVLRSYCSGGERILDIGANVGYVSCSLLHLVPDIQLVCVEPHPNTYKILAQNIADVGGGRGKALNVAVSDHEGAGTMAMRVGNSGANRVVTGDSPATVGETVQIELVTGTKLLELSGLDRVDLIKIDVEGHEEVVIRSLAPVLEKHRPRAVLFEHDKNLSDPASVIRGVFEQSGYKLLGIEKSLLRWSLTDLKTLTDSGRRAHDYVAVPS